MKLQLPTKRTSATNQETVGQSVNQARRQRGSPVLTTTK